MGRNVLAGVIAVVGAIGVACTAGAPPPTPQVIYVTPPPAIAGSPAPPAAATPEATGTAATDAPSEGLSISDDFSDPGSGWTTGEAPGASIAYADGALVLSSTQRRVTASSRRDLGASVDRVRVEADMTLAEDGADDGAYGLACGTGDADRYVFVLFADATYQLILVSGGEGSEIVRDDTPVEGVTRGSASRVSIECESNGSSSRFVVAVNGQDLQGHEGPGPTEFSQIGVFVQSQDDDPDGLSLTVDDATVTDDIAGGGEEEPSAGVGEEFSPPTDAASLLQVVPTALRANCGPPPVEPDSLVGEVAAAVCTTAEGTGVSYTLYDSRESMQNAFDQQRSDHGGASAGTDCSTGPGREVVTDAGGQRVGDALCWLQANSYARIASTDERFNIIVRATRLDDDFGKLYEGWRAGVLAQQ